jgi:hypothetical protein
VRILCINQVLRKTFITPVWIKSEIPILRRSKEFLDLADTGMWRREKRGGGVQEEILKAGEIHIHFFQKWEVQNFFLHSVIFFWKKRTIFAEKN